MTELTIFTNLPYTVLPAAPGSTLTTIYDGNNDVQLHIGNPPPPPVLTPLDTPWPTYEVPVPIRGGYIALVDAMNAVKAAGKKGQSVVFRLPPGVCMMPPVIDRSYSYDWTGYSTKDTHIVIAGALDGTTEIRGSLTSRTGALFNLPSYAIGMWRLADLSMRDIGYHAMTFGTGPYNNEKNVTVLQRLKGRYCTGNWIMAAAEQAGTTPPSGVGKTVINDELWMEDLDFRYSTNEHCFYIDERAYVYARRCNLFSGPQHAFKCTALKTEVEDCFFFNVDPVTRDAVTIGPGVSAVFPNGAVFYGRNATMSLISAGGGFVRNVHNLHVWPASTPYDAGGSAIQRTARWNLTTINKELIDPSDPNWWINAKAAGLDDPLNPYLLKHRFLWENCVFENVQPPGKSAKLRGIYVEAAYPETYVGSPQYPPLPLNWPDLWFNRSRDFMLNCTYPGSYYNFLGLPGFNATKYPVEAARVMVDADKMGKDYGSARPAWWPDAMSFTP